MSFSKASVRDAEVAGKRVLVRVDFNVPLDGGRVADDTRIRAALPTIEALRERGAALVLVSHLGRPQGEVVPELSLKPVGERLAELLGAPVEQAPAVVGADVETMAAGLSPGGVLLLENVRYEPGETKNDAALAAALARLADLYVNDAFGAAHRAHASTEGVAHRLPGYAGLLLQSEVERLTAVVESPQRPLVVVLGGAKVSDKVGVIDRFLELADSILIGGAMCFSFFRAQGIATGDSLVEEQGVKLAEEALARAEGARLRAAAPGRPGAGPQLRPGYRAARERRGRGAGRLDGPRRGTAHRGRLCRADRRGRHRALERADGRLRAGAVRRRHADRRRGGRRLARHDRGRRRRLGRGAERVRPG